MDRKLYFARIAYFGLVSVYSGELVSSVFYVPYSLTSAGNRFYPRIHDGHGDGVRPPLLQPGFFDFDFKFLNNGCLIKLCLLIYLVITPARANEFISNLILNVELQARARRGESFEHV